MLDASINIIVNVSLLCCLDAFSRRPMVLRWPRGDPETMSQPHLPHFTRLIRKETLSNERYRNCENLCALDPRKAPVLSTKRPAVV